MPSRPRQDQQRSRAAGSSEGHQAVVRRWLRILRSLLDGFVAIAVPMLAEIERDLAVPEGKVTVIPDPALSEGELHKLAGARSARDAQAGCRYLTAGRLAAQKNQMLLLEALARQAWAQDPLVSMERLIGYEQFGVLAPPGNPDALSEAVGAARHVRPDPVAMQRLAAGFTLESSGRLCLSRLAALTTDSRRRRQEKMRGNVRESRGGGV
ncbi:hypothetical protein MZO42_16135 [Sphingomonas psychrotolerans]|uniref:Uncharacterized protein n=1 Tax=Sphingomonas psychrotolerans TaxID=1327635 RepID=A0ABU3N6S3_9SPHN|nr:hypothetical protein [Sphingomonas psychrotolerans]MDT8760230.1 hypothetical protein [Sphingomonas psychrotolerans]